MATYSASVERHAKIVLVLIMIGGFSMRLALLIMLQQYDASFLRAGSLTDSYLFPRLNVNPWQVDWSYGPLTYLLYWTVSRISLASLIGKTINFAADLISTYLVAVIGARFLSKSRSLAAAASWAFAPPLIWASIFGSNDSLPILAMLGAVYFALIGRYARATVLVGVGFALKWFPILILPLIIRRYFSKQDLPKVLALSSFPFLLTGLLMAVSSNLSGIAFYGELALTLQNFSSRVSAGTSIWNLLYAVISQNTVSSTILILASYAAITLTLFVVNLGSRVDLDLHFLRSSAIILFSVVSISGQILYNYQLWYYPLTFILILAEPVLKLAVTKLALLTSSFIFNFLFTLPRLAGAIEQGPFALRASSSVYDILTIASFQASVWILLVMLTRQRIPNSLMHS